MEERPVFFRHGEIESPPFTPAGRREVGRLLGILQRGGSIGMPHARPMPGVGPRCWELRVRDARHNWRVMVRVDPDAVLVADVFAKTTPKTPTPVIDACQTRLAAYDRDPTRGG